MDRLRKSGAATPIHPQAEACGIPGPIVKNFKELEKFPIKVGYCSVICTVAETRYLDFSLAVHSFLRL